MGLPQTPNPPHLYPQALQLKLYQAFIFSIPILFSIILLLLFYLFYLKRRASSLSSASQPLPGSSSFHLTNVSSIRPLCACQIERTKQLKNSLPTVSFDDELRTRDLQCCVCLGEFEIKEELLQIPSCKHVFHIECINHWLHSKSTCPLCRCLVVPTTTEPNDQTDQPIASRPQLHQDNAEFIHQHQLQLVRAISNQEVVVPIHEESRVETFIIGSSNLPEPALVASSSQDHVVLQIPIHEDRDSK